MVLNQSMRIHVESESDTQKVWFAALGHFKLLHASITALLDLLLRRRTSWPLGMHIWRFAKRVFPQPASPPVELHSSESLESSKDSYKGRDKALVVHPYITCIYSHLYI